MCTAIICRNGGTCEKGICHCEPDFTGLLCETGDYFYRIMSEKKNKCKEIFNMAGSVFVDLCDGINCQNSGECKAGVCECSSAQYTGVHCETGKILTIEKLFEAEYFKIRW